MPSHALGSCLGRLVAGLRAGGCMALFTASAELIGAEPVPPAITDPAAVWSLSAEAKRQPNAVRIEGRVDYYDPLWKMVWLRQGDTAIYLLMSADAPVMRAGQRVVLEGNLVPDKGLSADTIAVHVLRDFEPITPLPTAGRFGDLTALHGRIVTVDAFVDGQQYIDADHVRLALIVEDRPAIAWVKPDDPTAIPNWEGKFVRLEALYSARFDPTNTETSVELWVGEQKHLEVQGALADAARFTHPVTPINELYRQPGDAEVRVRGRVETHETGAFMTIRDGTGRVVVRTLQQQRFPFDAPVEAVGRVGVEGSRWILRSALCRRLPADAVAVTAPAAGDVLGSVDQIRQLNLDDAVRGRPVSIAGLVTWSLPGNDFFFLQDVSGGIRVRYDPAKMETPPLGKYYRVEGVTYAGGAVPAVQLQRVTDLGSMSAPPAKPVTYEQAITGKEDGQWVEMRGFVQRTVSEGDWRWIHIITPGGEVVAQMQSPVAFVANPGSLTRVRGVCETVTDDNGQLNGVRLRVPFLHNFTIEEDAPVDYYDLPLSSIKGLRQLSGVRDMTRVRIAGTVLHAVPGRVVYVQEGDTGLPLLTHDATPVAAGDTLEAVGILGWAGRRIVLREAVYRRTGGGTPPAPLPLGDPTRPIPAFDARLVRVRGTLINASRHQDHLQLTLQAAGTFFEATLEGGGADADPPVGAGLELTGLYQLVFDDARQTRGFALQLRAPADIVVVEKPRLWTLQRALVVVAVLGGCTLLGVAWITALRRRVRRQTHQIRAQLERQAKLEADVQRAARLESLGVLAGGIAHDFNNLLTVIMGNLGLAMLEENLTSNLGHYLREIERGASRARSLTRQLLTFAKGGDPLCAPVALGEVVRETATLALRGTKAVAVFDFAPEVWSASVDRDQIAQVVKNLAANAIEAMPKGGRVRFLLRNERVAEPHGSLRSGRYVKLSIADEGEGIAPEVLPRIFDPYFSTKRASSGLGLATAYSVVKRHHGHVEVESAPGAGATFHLWLPAADAPVAAVPAPSSGSPFAATTGPVAQPRVLLLDDEDSIRDVVTAVLRRMGHEVVAVADGDAALREFRAAREKGASFDLVILDLTITDGMGGKEAMALIRQLDPHVPAIVSSGYSNDPVLANYADYGFQAVVAKPYELSQLAAVVNRLLGRVKVTVAAARPSVETGA